MPAIAEPKPETTTPSEKIEREPLAEVIDEVRRDAQVKPTSYTRETIVQEGGE